MLAVCLFRLSVCCRKVNLLCVTHIQGVPAARLTLSAWLRSTACWFTWEMTQTWSGRYNWKREGVETTETPIFIIYMTFLWTLSSGNMITPPHHHHPRPPWETQTQKLPCSSLQIWQTWVGKKKLIERKRGGEASQVGRNQTKTDILFGHITDCDSIRSALKWRPSCRSDGIRINSFFRV